MIRILAMIAAMVLWNAGAVAETGSSHYKIYRNNELIGHYEFKVQEDEGRRQVEVVMDIEASLLFLPVYSAHQQRREIWDNDLLLELEGQSNYNDQIYDIKLVYNGNDQYSLSVNGETQVVSGFTLTLTPWLITGWDKAILLTEKGKTKRVNNTLKGQELIDFKGDEVKAFHYSLDGDVQRDLWYDDSGKLLKLSYEKDGAEIRFELDDTGTEQEESDGT